MKKKLTLFLLIALMISSLAGCSSNVKKDDAKEEARVVAR